MRPCVRRGGTAPPARWARPLFHRACAANQAHAPRPQVFGAVWDSALPERRAPLSRLFATWGGVFPAQVLERVQARMVSAAPPPMQQQHLPPMQQQQHVLHVPGAAAYGVPPLQPTTVVSLAPPVQLQLGPMQLPQYAPPPMHLQAPAVMLPPGALPPSPQRGGWPQQQHQQQHLQQQQMPFDPRRRSPSPYGGPQQQQRLAPGHLSSLLSSLAQTGILKAPAARADDPALRTTELTPAFVKVIAARALTARPSPRRPPQLWCGHAPVCALALRMRPGRWGCRGSPRRRGWERRPVPLRRESSGARCAAVDHCFQAFRAGFPAHGPFVSVATRSGPAAAPRKVHFSPPWRPLGRRLDGWSAARTRPAGPPQRELTPTTTPPRC